MRVLRLAVLFSALCGAGCAGSLEAARAPRAVAVSPEQSDRCTRLDDEHAVTGGFAKAFAVAGGASGLASIPVDDDKRLRIGLAIGAVTSAAIAVGMQFISDAAATSWSRECAR